MPIATPDVLTIAGAAIDLVATDTSIDHLVAFARGGTPELGFSRLQPTPGVLPDPWNLKPCTLTMQGLLVFSGTVTGYIDRHDRDLGWMREYRAMGLAWAGNYVPVTDNLTYSDTSTWNLPDDDPSQLASRTGQSVGEIVGHILCMDVNADPLSALGIGAYTSLLPPTLPAATTADLAALTVIPMTAVRVFGERILPALESFVQSYHPNHFLHVQPDGTIRFLDPRTFAAQHVVLNDPADPRWDLPQLTRDASDNYSRVLVRGNTLVRAVTLQDQPWAGSTAPDGGLQEAFEHNYLSSDAAKAAWHPSDWSAPNTHGAPMDVGPCTCDDTLHVTITTTLTFVAGDLDQAHLQGWLVLQADSLSGLIQQFFTARIISNTNAAGGTVTCMLDLPLPSLAYQSYQLFGLAAGSNVVGRRYRVTNAAIAHEMVNAFPYPVPYLYNSGLAAMMVSSPVGTVFYNATGTGPPYTSSTAAIVLDPDGGYVWFDEPTPVTVGGWMDPPRWPAVVQALVPVAVGALQAVAPPDLGGVPQYAGTLYATEGVARTKTITVLEWRDLSNSNSMQTYAAEFLDACKDVVVEGTLPYFGLPDLGYLTPGRSVSIAGGCGAGWTTGWESLSLPVVSVEVAFQPGASGTSYATSLQLSNRRTPYSPANFLRPNVAVGGAMIGGPEGGFGPGMAGAQELSAKQQAEGALQTRQIDAVRAYQAAGGGDQALPQDFRSLGIDPTQEGFDPHAAMAGLAADVGAGPISGFTGGMANPAWAAQAMGERQAGMVGGGLTRAGGAIADAAREGADRMGATARGPQRLERPEERREREQREERAREEQEKRAREALARGQSQAAGEQAAAGQAPEFVPRAGPLPRAD